MLFLYLVYIFYKTRTIHKELLKQTNPHPKADLVAVAV